MMTRVLAIVFWVALTHLTCIKGGSNSYYDGIRPTPDPSKFILQLNMNVDTQFPRWPQKTFVNRCCQKVSRRSAFYRGFTNISLPSLFQ